MGKGLPSAMDERRLQLFNRALDEMTGGVITQARWGQTVCEDLGLVESQAMDVIVRFFSFWDDMCFMVNSGIIQPPPDEDEPEVMRELIEMARSGLIDAHPHEVSSSSLFEADIESRTADILICKEGATYLELAIRSGMYIRFSINRSYTTVSHIIEFIKEVELMELPEELIASPVLRKAA